VNDPILQFAEALIDRISRLSRGERWFTTAAIAFGLLATVCYLTNTPGLQNHPIVGAMVLAGNGPGFLLAIIPFALLGGFSTFDGGDAVPLALLVLCVGNLIGWGVLSYLLVALRHRHGAGPAAI